MKQLKLIPFMLLLWVFGCQFQKSIPEVVSMEDLEYPFSMKKVVLSDGKVLAYGEEGKGKKTLLMIHGLGSYAPAWVRNMEGLGEDFRCIAVDLPGYGHSSKGKYEGGMRFFADVIKEFVDSLELGEVTLVGHSMGGQIALTAALAYPAQFKELVLIAPAGFETFHAGQRDWFRNVISPTAVRLTSVDQIKTNLASNFYKMPQEAEFMVRDRIAMRQCNDFGGYCYIIPMCIQGMVDDPVFEDLSQIEARTLVIFGEQDNLIPNPYLHGGRSRTIGEQGVAKMPKATLEMVDKAGHFVHFEQSDTVNSLIHNFLTAE